MSPKLGFGVILEVGGRVGAKIFGGKVHPSLELCVFRHLWSRSDAPCSSIMYGYSHLSLAKIWTSLGVPSSPIRSRTKSPMPKSPLWTYDYHMEKSESFCDVTPGLQEGTFQGFCKGKIGENPKIVNFDAPYLCNRTSQRKVDRPRNSLAFGLQRGVNSISLQCIP